MIEKNGVEMTRKYLVFGKKYGLDIFGGIKADLLKELKQRLEVKKGLTWLATINPEFVLESQKDSNFQQILNKTSINCVDGIGLIWADKVIQFSIFNFQFSRLGVVGRLLAGFWIGINVLRGKYRNRIAPGSELIVDLTKIAVRKKWKVFFLGGFGDGAKKTGEYINSSIVPDGLCHRNSALLRNYELRFKTCEGRPRYNDAQVLLLIQKYKPQMLFVAYGMKKQEEWVYKYKKELEKTGVRLVMGVGRSFDYYSGQIPLAPMWVKKMGLEWLFALVVDPKRWRRDIKLVGFIKMVLAGK